MLHVMSECGLDPFGIDSDQVCIDQCLKAGFRTKKIDISSFLRNESAHSCDLVTAIHVVEHVGYDDLIGWLRDIFRILKSDGVFILETPNPHAVDAFKAFWVDPTHVRPYYPESLLAILQEVGFRRAHVEAQGDQTAVQDRLEFAGSYSIVARK
jgi:O-antigen chain-terminating methyltransferase